MPSRTRTNGGLFKGKLIPIGRTFFAVALVGLGLEHFVFQEFVVGRPPSWPESLPGGIMWAYLTGAMFIAAAAAMLLGWKGRHAAILVSVMILWALLRHIPVLATDTFLSGEWTKAGKALTFCGGSLAVAATYPRLRAGQDRRLVRFFNLRSEFVVVGRLCLGLFLVITGIQHFMYTEFVASLIPGWFPGDAVFWTYAAGVALTAGGIGLFIPPTARLAALLTGVMVFSWFWIVHIPRTFFGMSDSIAVFEALAVSGIALLISGYVSGTDSDGHIGMMEGDMADFVGTAGTSSHTAVG